MSRPRTAFVVPQHCATSPLLLARIALSSSSLSSTHTVLLMLGTAPDSTSLFSTSRAYTNDDDLRSLLGSSAGQSLGVDPEHFLFKSSGGTKVVNDASLTHAKVNWSNVDWSVGRMVNVEDLADIQASWVFRPDFLSQVFMDAQQVGGLVYDRVPHSGNRS